MEVAKKLKGLVTVGAVQCDDVKNQALCEKYNVRRYPTIKTFNLKINDKSDIVKSTRGKLKKKPWWFDIGIIFLYVYLNVTYLYILDYLGPRDSKLLVKYLLSNLPSNVLSIKGDARKVESKSSISLDDFLEQEVSYREIGI